MLLDHLGDLVGGLAIYEDAFGNQREIDAATGWNLNLGTRIFWLLKDIDRDYVLRSEPVVGEEAVVGLNDGRLFRALIRAIGFGVVGDFRRRLSLTLVNLRVSRLAVRRGGVRRLGVRRLVVGRSGVRRFRIRRLGVCRLGVTTRLRVFTGRLLRVIRARASLPGRVSRRLAEGARHDRGGVPRP